MFVAQRGLSTSSSVGAECADMSLLRSYDGKEGRVGYKHSAPDGASQTASETARPHLSAYEMLTSFQLPSFLKTLSLPQPRQRTSRLRSSFQAR